MSKMCKIINICRCCLTSDCYKDISTEYFFSGLKEVYAEMLLHTFNIEISYKEGSGPSSASRLICDSCIRRLRDASDFRRQVLQAEERFTEHLRILTCGDIKEPILPKSEEIQLQDFLDNNFDHFTVQSDSDIHVKDKHGHVEIKHEKVSISNEDVPEISFQPYEHPLGNNKKGPKRKVTRNKSRNENKLPRKNIGMPRRISPSDIALRANTEKLVTNSNMCPFKSLKTKYQCFYCTEAYLDVRELRAHSHTHTDRAEKTRHILRNSHFKCAEITDLKCSLCDENITTIDELKTHLNQRHDIPFADGAYALIPYRIESEFKCFHCAATFQTFLRLSIHMHTHYSNHVCELCGASFINKDSLRIHMSVHRERTCTVCLATFKSPKEQLRHCRSVHKLTDRWRRYCLKCDATFKYTYLLEAHMVSVHGAATKEADCKECGKTFKTPYYLKVHVRSVHRRERRHACARCAMRFFTKTDRARHERSHGLADDQLIACDLCAVKFKSKDSWRRHVRRQHAKD